ncbi:M3 family metallopeptidase [Mucilaginibacter sp.]
MKNLFILALTTLMAIMASCKSKTASTTGIADTLASNPLITKSTLDFGVPAFDKIKDADFQPAFDQGIKEELAEIDTIANNPATPTFDNTLVALEKSGQLLNRVNGVYNLLSSANTDPVLEKLDEAIAPKLAGLQDAIYLNTKLYNRVEAIYQQKSALKLDSESTRLLDYYDQEFKLAGANLSESNKDTLKKYNQEEAGLSAKFTNMVLAANKAGALLVSNKADLAGLPDADLQAAAANAKAAGHYRQWLISLKNTTTQPALQSLSNRATRQKLFEASYTRTEKGDSNDTRAVIEHIAKIRALKAQLVGFKNYADWKLRDQMAKSPEAVDSFLSKLIPAATAKARAEAVDIQAAIDQQKGGFKLQPWDWDFYAEQVRKAKYDLNEDEIKPYFEINKVLQDGVFYAANQLYGLTFKERKDLPVYEPTVRVFNVYDKDGTQLGIFYCDYFKRDNKNGGAWMSNITNQSKLLGLKPVIYNICNFTKPAAGQPALISYEDVTTMFHEFGHALHGFFASQQYPSLSGTNVARDYVEFPSQFNEHWALYPQVLKHYAVHYKTGQPMPQALIDKIKKAGTFNQGYALTEALADDAIDMKWHELPGNAPLQAADKFEAASLQQAGLNLPQVPPRYRSSYFLHIWSNGYAAGYYAYAWTEMLDDDAFSWFTENGGLTRANGQRFRDMILSRGNTIEYGKMFRDFRGHNPDIKPMEKDRGLIPQ